MRARIECARDPKYAVQISQGHYLPWTRAVYHSVETTRSLSIENPPCGKPSSLVCNNSIFVVLNQMSDKRFKNHLWRKEID